MCRPSPITPTTSLVQIVPRPNPDPKKDEDPWIVLPKVQEAHRDTSSQREKDSCPFPLQDDRKITCELAHPIITETIEELARRDPQILQILDKLELSNEHISQLRKKLAKRNAWVVEVSPGCTACLACNTAAMCLGGAEQAKAAIFYLLQYITKNKVEITNALSVLDKARNDIEKRPSRAEDSGTEQRTGMHLVERVLNILSTQVSQTPPLTAIEQPVTQVKCSHLIPASSTTSTGGDIGHPSCGNPTRYAVSNVHGHVHLRLHARGSRFREATADQPSHWHRRCGGLGHREGDHRGT